MMGNSVMTRSVVFNNTSIHYQLERKNVKNLNLRIKRDGSVYVSASPVISENEIDQFVIQKESYIISAINSFQELTQYQPQPKQYVSGESFTILGRSLRLKVIQGKKNEVFSDGVFLYLQVKDTEDFVTKQRIMTKYLNQRCYETFEEIVDEINPLFKKYGVERPVLRIRNMETRWGTCLAKKGIITLNKRLLEAPRNCIEYVVTHEFCHFIHANHSKQFYSFLTMLMPDWKERKEVLNKYARYWL